jgi:hypothetical protein
MVGFLSRKSRVGFLRATLLSFLLTPTVFLIYLLLFASLETNGDAAVRDRASGR